MPLEHLENRTNGVDELGRREPEANVDLVTGVSKFLESRLGDLFGN